MDGLLESIFVLVVGDARCPPPSDCLVLLCFKDKSDKVQGNKERSSVTLEEICGLEPGQWYEGVAFTLVVLCLNQAALLGFDSREALQAWDVRLRYSLGEGENVHDLLYVHPLLLMLHFRDPKQRFLPKKQHMTSLLCCCSNDQTGLLIVFARFSV